MSKFPKIRIGKNFTIDDFEVPPNGILRDIYISHNDGIQFINLTMITDDLEIDTDNLRPYANIVLKGLRND